MLLPAALLAALLAPTATGMGPPFCGQVELHPQLQQNLQLICDDDTGHATLLAAVMRTTTMAPVTRAKRASGRDAGRPERSSLTRKIGTATTETNVWSDSDTTASAAASRPCAPRPASGSHRAVAATVAATTAAPAPQQQ